MYLPLSPELAAGAAQLLIVVTAALGALFSFLWTGRA